MREKKTQDDLYSTFCENFNHFHLPVSNKIECYIWKTKRTHSTVSFHSSTFIVLLSNKFLFLFFFHILAFNHGVSVLSLLPSDTRKFKEAFSLLFTFHDILKANVSECVRTCESAWIGLGSKLNRQKGEKKHNRLKRTLFEQQQQQQTGKMNICGLSAEYESRLPYSSIECVSVSNKIVVFLT